MKQPILLFWLSAITLFSCTDPQIIGLEIQPEGDKITISSKSNDSPFTALTKKVDSVRSSQTVYALLGNYESANLLDAKASFSTHLRLSDNAVDFGTNPVLDSAVMTLAYAGYYGDTTIEMNIQVEQLSEEIHDTTTYFSDDVFSTSPFSSPLEYSFFPTPNNGGVFSTSSIAWAGSLSHNDYKNNVSRITKNVLDRFISNKKLLDGTP